MSNDEPVQGDQLKSIVQRIERLEEEKKTVGDDIKEVYHEARANGYDVKVLRKVVALRKRDINERREEEAVLDLYLQAVGESSDGPAPTVNRPSRVEQAAAAMAQTLKDAGATMEVCAAPGSIFAKAGEAVKDAGGDVVFTDPQTELNRRRSQEAAMVPEASANADDDPFGDGLAE